MAQKATMNRLSLGQTCNMLNPPARCGCRSRDDSLPGGLQNCWCDCAVVLAQRSENVLPSGKEELVRLVNYRQ